VVQNIKLTKRVKVVVGFKCNANCIFCYYKDFLKKPLISKEKIKKDILFALRYGIEEIDFSGGEPTIHPDLPELIYFAKKKGIKKVCIITNGIALAKKEYLKLLIDSGLDEILFSLQGYDESSHDFLVGFKGAYSKLMKALENAYKLPVKIRINSVIHKINYKKALTIAKVASLFSPHQFNFITINDWKCASFSFEELILPYSEISSPLKEACSFLEKNLENINIRYVPFCFFLGYEKYICGHFQVLYDPFEWDPYVRVRLEKHYPPFAWIFMIIYGAFKKRDFSLIKEKKYREFLNQCIVTSIRAYGYTKAKKCKECRYFYLCDGVEKSYAKKLGLDELKPVKGERIKEYYYFRKHLFKI